jgi:hypothetical protein
VNDRAYAAAVLSGNMAAAQAMVDEAASHSGYSIGPVFHGTGDCSLSGFSRQSHRTHGIYLSADERYARSYGDHFVRAHARTSKPYQISMPNDWGLNGTVVLDGMILSPSYRKLTAENIAVLENAGYDGIVVKVTGPLPYGEWKDNPRNPFEVVIFDPSNVKTTAAAEYDGSGLLVPLSVRFAPGANDLRGKLGTAKVPPPPSEPFPLETTVPETLATSARTP